MSLKTSGVVIWSFMSGGSGVRDADGQFVNFRVDWCARVMNWCAFGLLTAALYSSLWSLWVSSWLWWSAGIGVAVAASLRVRFVVAAAEGEHLPTRRLLPATWIQRWWLWLADRCDQDADESLAKAETAKDTLRVATKLHRARKSRELAEQYRQRADTGTHS